MGTKFKWFLGFLIVTAIDAWFYTDAIANSDPWTRFLFSAGKYALGAFGVMATIYVMRKGIDD